MTGKWALRGVFSDKRINLKNQIMKRTLLNIFLLFTITISYSQKADKSYLDIYYNHYPTKPFPLAVKTYNVQISNNCPEISIGEKERGMLKIRGFGEAIINNADIWLLFQIESVRNDVKFNQEEIKTKVDDKEVTKILYSFEASSMIFCDLNMKYRSGAGIEALTYSGEKFMTTYKSSQYQTMDEAKKDYNKNKGAIIDKNNKGALNKVLSSIKSRLDNNYAYYRAFETAIISTGKSRKYDYSDLDATLEKFKTAANAYNKEKYSDYNKIAIECINEWNGILKEYDPDDKKARISSKNADNIYFNIAQAYLYMDEFEKALDYTNKGISINSDYIKRMFISTINDREQRFKKNIERVEGKITMPVSTGPGYSELAYIYDKYPINRHNTTQENNLILQNALKLIKVTDVIDNINSLYWGNINDGQFYKYDSLSYTTGLKITHPDKYLYDSYELKLNNDSIVLYGYSTRYTKIFWPQWMDNKIINLTVDRTGYEFRYDIYGNLIKIIGTDITENSKYGKVRNEYLIESEDGDILKIVSCLSNMRGEIVSEEKAITFKDSGNDFITEHFYATNGKIDEISIGKVICTKLSDKHYIVDYKLKDLHQNEEIKFNNYNIPMFFKSTKNDVVRETSYEYDSNKKLFKEITLVYNNKGEYTGKEISIEYTVGKESDPLKPYEWKKGLYKFDKNGEWVFESDNIQFREKENGVWKNWEYYRY